MLVKLGTATGNEPDDLVGLLLACHGRIRRFSELARTLGTRSDLPDVEVPVGGRPTFTEQEIRESVERKLGEDIGRLRRAVVVKTRVTLVQTALSHLPPRAEGDLRQDG